MTVRPVALTVQGAHVAGFLHPAAGGTAVVLIPPFGWDEQTSHRPRRDWATALAVAGYPALRVDLPGTGDAAGSPRDPDLVAAWTATTAAAAEWLRAHGATRVAGIAMGLGGLLTLAGGGRYDDLVLWGAPARGRTALRELRAFGRLEASQTGEDAEDVPDGELRAGGHVLDAATVRAIEALDATGPIVVPARALVLGRDGRGPEEGLVAALRATGAAVRTGRGDGWGGATAEPPTVPPTDLFAFVGDWLAEVPAQGAFAAPPACGPVTVDGVQETALTFDGAGARLFGVLSQPPAGPATGTVVLYNAGALRHVGPNRMWTEAARRWSARGLAVLRVDLEGIGEAEGDPAPYLNVDLFHTEALRAQARAALDAAVAHGAPDRFVVAGLCSGGYWAFQTAVADPRVAAVVTLNQRMMVFDADAERQRELGAALRVLTPAGFRHLRASHRRWAYLRRLLIWMLRTPVRLLRRGASADALSVALHTLHERGQSLDLAFSGEEYLHDALRLQPRHRELETLGVRLHDLPGVSHTLKPLAAQRAAHALLDAVVDRAFPERP